MSEKDKQTTDTVKPKPSVNIRLIKPGVKACGQYLAGEIHAVEGNEAERLVRVKGFEVVSAADAAKHKTTQGES